jgi:GNAT superfamily N-acetyltransferase
MELLMQVTSVTKIKRVTEEDIVNLSILSKQFSKEAKENGYNLAFKQDKFTQSFVAIINNPDYYYLVAEIDDEAIGFFLGAIFHPLFSEDTIAAEMFWWVDKEHRGHSAAIKMLKSFEDWAEKSGATQINVSDLQGVKNLDKLYQRLGYKRSEVTYRKDI